jgi:hypothetical protein
MPQRGAERKPGWRVVRHEPAARQLSLHLLPCPGLSLLRAGEGVNDPGPRGSLVIRSRDGSRAIFCSASVGNRPTVARQIASTTCSSDRVQSNTWSSRLANGSAVRKSPVTLARAGGRGVRTRPGRPRGRTHSDADRPTGHPVPDEDRSAKGQGKLGSRGRHLPGPSGGRTRVWPQSTAALRSAISCLISAGIDPGAKKSPVVTIPKVRLIFFGSVRTFGLPQPLRFGRKVVVWHQWVKPSQKISPENPISRMKNVDKR